VNEVLRRTKLSTRTHDTAEAAAAVARTHVAHGVEADPAGVPFAFEERVRGTELLSLETTTSTGVLTGDVEPGNAMVIVWLKAGRGAVDGNPVPVGRPVLYRNTRQSFRWESFQKDVLRIDRSIVEHVAAERGGWEPGPLEFNPHHIPEGPALAAWWIMVRTVAGAVLGGPDEVTVDAERDLARVAAVGLLTAIPHWPEGTRRERPPHAGMAKAEAFLLEHVVEPVTVAEVAAAAGMSVRGIQAAFQRAHGQSPLAYQRNVRLLMAREQLESGTPASVAEVVRAVGFSHLSRFAAAYQRTFGELPRDTLRNAREVR
jgi:AraC-like DNA-binding protein